MDLKGPVRMSIFIIFKWIHKPTEHFRSFTPLACETLRLSRSCFTPWAFRRCRPCRSFQSKAKQNLTRSVRWMKFHPPATNWTNSESGKWTLRSRSKKMGVKTLECTLVDPKRSSKGDCIEKGVSIFVPCT